MTMKLEFNIDDITRDTAAARGPDGAALRRDGDRVAMDSSRPTAIALGVMFPRAVDAWETTDRKLHASRSAAEAHQRAIDGSANATHALENGASLGEALRIGGFISEGSFPELDEVFATTKLVIEHWQCRSQPGYQPRFIDGNGCVFVHGDAGSWSGPYGAACLPVDVVRYWLDTKRRAERSVRP